MKDLLRKKINRHATGASPFDFNLPDTSGVEHRLSGYYGKIILIDIWSNNCTGCLEFSRKLKNEILPNIKVPENLVILSININRDLEKWKKAIPIYSSSEYINLNTGGVGIQHPLINHYGLEGVPYIILIDAKGRVITTSVYDAQLLSGLINDELTKI